jgi:hypothetical protein
MKDRALSTSRKLGETAVFALVFAVDSLTLKSIICFYVSTATMKTFQIATLFALIASAMAFAPNQTPQGECFFLYISSPFRC